MIVSALGDGFTRLFSGAGRPEPTFHEQMDAIEHRAGSVTAAAKEVGVDRRTWQRWRTGKIANPKAERLLRVGLTARMARLPRDLPTDATVRLRTEGGAKRTNNLGAGNLKLAPGTMDATTRTWLITGDGEATQRTFRDGVGDEWYRDTYLADDPESLDPEYGDSPILPDAITVA